jgi:cell division protein FtsL
MIEILNTVLFVFLVLCAISVAFSIWLAIGLWHALASKEPETRKTVIFQGSDNE